MNSEGIQLFGLVALIFPVGTENEVLLFCVRDSVWRLILISCYDVLSSWFAEFCNCMEYRVCIRFLIVERVLNPEPLLSLVCYWSWVLSFDTQKKLKNKISGWLMGLPHKFEAQQLNNVYVLIVYNFNISWDKELKSNEQNPHDYFNVWSESRLEIVALL